MEIYFGLLSGHEHAVSLFIHTFISVYILHGKMKGIIWTLVQHIPRLSLSKANP